MSTYRIKAFSKLTATTVRTLHYYDEIGLLKPTHRSNSAHRLYSEGDILTLQQIKTFKFLGFSLHQIKMLIQHPDFDLKESLKNQAKVLAVESVKMLQAARLIEKISKQLEDVKCIDWQTINQSIEVLHMTKPELNNWLKIFSPEELDEFNKMVEHHPREQMIEYGKKWEKLFAEVKSKLATDPQGEVGQTLAKKWLALVDELYGKNHNIIRQKAWEAMKSGAMPKDNMPYYDQEVIDYIDKATCYLYGKKI